MGSNPNPHRSISANDGHGPIMVADPRRPVSAFDRFEMQRRMPGIYGPKPEILQRELLDLLGELFVALPEIGRSPRISRQRSQLPRLGFCFRLVCHLIKLARCGVGLHLAIPSIILPAVKQTIQLRPLFQREVVDGFLDLENTHVRTLRLSGLVSTPKAPRIRFAATTGFWLGFAYAAVLAVSRISGATIFLA